MRKLNLTGGTLTGGLVISNARNLTFRKEDGSNQFAINPNVTSDYFTNIYTFNSVDGGGGVRFRVSQDQGGGQSSYDTLVSLSGETHDIGGVEYRGRFSLNRVKTPESPDQAANKWYVDNAFSNAVFLPLTGGDSDWQDINMTLGLTPSMLMACKPWRLLHLFLSKHETCFVLFEPVAPS